jgi:TolB-like protein/Flp pilus assembly protein TadD
MKRCPECRRDYYDDTLSFCLNDGTELVYGLSPDEPATAILHSTVAPGEAPTRAQINMTDQTAILPTGTGNVVPKPRGFDKRLLFAPFALAVIVLGGFFGYRYLTPANQINSIAVMPFVNESKNEDVEYLSDGMTETLIKSLSNIPDMDVKPRSAVFRYKGKDTDISTIGKELNVQAVLNGRVTQRGDQLTLSLELVDVEKNRVMWTEQYQRRQADVVSLQSEIAKDVSAKLSPQLSGADETKVAKQATADPAAYQAYLRGRYYWNKRTGENMYKAIEQFQIAIDRDPNYAIAYAGLADAYALLPDWATNAPADSRLRAEAFARKAIELDGQLAEPHATLGQLQYQKWQWAEAETEYKRAIEINPNYATARHWYSVLLYALARNEEGHAMITRAHEIDPMSSIISQNFAQMLRMKGDYKAAIEVCQRIIDLDPNFPGGHFTIGGLYLKSGKNDEAIAAFQKSMELSDRHSYSVADLGAAFAASGRKKEALELLQELERRYDVKDANPSDLATIYAALGDKDNAFLWLDKELLSPDGRLASSRWIRQFEPLQDDPRFKNLLKRMGLPE